LVFDTVTFTNGIPGFYYWDATHTQWVRLATGIGSTGATGVTGATGTAGTNGTNGVDGAAGANGATGANGTSGVTGATGATGLTGPIGCTSTNYVLKNNGTNATCSQIFDNGTSVGIGTTGPTGSAILELSSTTQGTLIPRMTVVQRDAITSPATGLIIYNTDCNDINYYNGSAWTLVTTTNCGFVSDIDGNNYKTVVIGTQCWMKENLKATYYSDGTAMVDGTTAGDITGDYTTKYYFDYANTPANTVTYGKLYTWAAVMNGAASSNLEPSGVQGPCPKGWHVPSHYEWNTLERAVCTSGTCVTDFPYDITTLNWRGTDEGSKLKETGTTHWAVPSTGATNCSGFTALPGGFRGNGGSFGNGGNGGLWWSSTESDASTVWSRSLHSNDVTVGRASHGKEDGFSVRCLKDN
jgi:uncharacterized protein (TIGR02145 family)